MPLTFKQDQFAQAVALKGMTQSEAYASVYDTSKSTAKTVAESASRLAAEPNVRARIAVLVERATGAAVKIGARTLAADMADADIAIGNARALGQVAAEVAAIKLRAQLAGNLVEKKEVRSGALDEMDLEHLAVLRAMADAEIQRTRDAVELTDSTSSAAQPAAPVMRRAIG